MNIKRGDAYHTRGNLFPNTLTNKFNCNVFSDRSFIEIARYVSMKKEQCVPSTRARPSKRRIFFIGLTPISDSQEPGIFLIPPVNPTLCSERVSTERTGYHSPYFHGPFLPHPRVNGSGCIYEREGGTPTRFFLSRRTMGNVERQIRRIFFLALM